MAAAIALWPTMVPSSRHHHTEQYAARQGYVIKTRKYYCVYYLLAILRHDALLTCHACVFAGCVRGQRYEYHTPSGLC
jgi:hypothetical protein